MEHDTWREIELLRELDADAQATIAALQARLESANTLLHKKNCALGRADTIINDLQSQLTQRTAELERVRALIKALPKVEGDWTVSCALAVTVVTGGIVRDISEVVAAIVQHRQGMEG